VVTFSEWRTNPDAMQELCDFLVSNGTKGHISEFCRQRGFSYSTLRSWIEADPARVAMYARAREDRADILADEIAAISDEAAVESVLTPDGEMTLKLDATAVARNRLRVDARKWAAAKLKPRVYGDKVAVSGDPDNPVQHVHEIRRTVVRPEPADR
jgi:hypothetical protein